MTTQMKTPDNLKNRLKALEDNIQELKDRLPAHSIKPGMMMELMALEDERDSILAQIQSLEVKKK